MRFFEALQGHNRPIRRAAWCHHNGPRASYETVNAPQWITIGERSYGFAGKIRHPLLVVATGEEITLSREDYLADDWEAMP